MATIDWPVTLPQNFLQPGYSEGDVDNVIGTGMLAGPEKRRPRSTEGYIPITGTMNLVYNQKVIFDDFYKSTISYGALPFNLPTFGGIILEVFLDSKKITPLSGTTWQLVMTVKSLA
jgi:hypothetical protein